MIVGSTESGLIWCTPGPGMANVMVSSPGWLFALVITWRSEPMPLSLTLVTTKALETADSFQNAELSLLMLLVAMAVGTVPSASVSGIVKKNGAEPLGLAGMVSVLNRVSACGLMAGLV